MPELPPPPAVVENAAPWPAVLRWLTACRARFGKTALALGGLAAVVVLSTVAFVAFRAGGLAAPPELSLPRAADDQVDGRAGPDQRSRDESGSGGADGVEDGADGPLVVHVAGAVTRPGVYRLAVGSRLADALDAAGGPALDAALDSVNLAAKLNDGERVYLPRKGEEVAGPVASASPSASGAPSGPLDLNTATQDQLEELPGVGPATAAAILEYRQQHGRFRSVDELLEVRGIGDAKFASLRPKVRVR